MSSASSIVTVRSLTKRFKQYTTPAARLLEWLSFGAVQRHSVFTALEDISFEVRKGEFFGIVGPNGSGKSTLLKVLTGVLMPTSGSFSISGRVTSLLELGTGFNPELTGRENLINSGRLLGFEVAQTRRRMDQIIDFAELGEQIDLPIKYYSTGMVVRLAFSLFAHIEPDIFIVDEALSVGDVGFSRKCFQRLDAMRDAGCTLLFVSHDLAAVRKYCENAMFLQHGRCAFLGSANAATDVYLESMSLGRRAQVLSPQSAASGEGAEAEHDSAMDAARENLPATMRQWFDDASFANLRGRAEGRVGTSEFRIGAVSVLDDSGAHKEHFAVGQTVHIHVLALATVNVSAATIGLQLVNRLGVIAWGNNHHRLSGQTISIGARQWLHAIFSIQLDLGPDHYTLDVSLGDASGHGYVYDRLTAVHTIVIDGQGNRDFEGVARLPVRADVEISGADTTHAARASSAVETISTPAGVA